MTTHTSIYGVHVVEVTRSKEYPNQLTITFNDDSNLLVFDDVQLINTEYQCVKVLPDGTQIRQNRGDKDENKK